MASIASISLLKVSSEGFSEINPRFSTFNPSSPSFTISYFLSSKILSFAFFLIYSLTAESIADLLSLYSFSEESLVLFTILLCKVLSRIPLKNLKSLVFLPSTLTIFLCSLEVLISSIRMFLNNSNTLSSYLPSTSEGEIKGFRYDFFTAWLAQSIKDLYYKVVGVDERVKVLEAKNAELEARLLKLENEP